MRRIKIDIAFLKEEQADAFWTALKNSLAGKELGHIIHESHFVHYEDCLHNEQPPGKCVTIQRIEK